ncbi:unnamed protein product [Urochloa decumbens]|uniref:DUF6598 domain-containing protein n=1 Tax=Urochloa decumbens TaxID=240449 RepID=A0ABC9G083_9POAL
MWIAIHSCWGTVFEDITTIEPMQYTKAPVPRYVYNYGPPDTLQIFSVKVGGIHDGGLQWPLHVFGLIAVRDSIDQNRNVIFNRTRDDCQTITQEDPYLILTGPTRAVVMNEESIPVTIEAELKVKGTHASEDKHLIFAVVALPSEFGSGSIDLAGRYRNLEIALGRIMACVEATIFTRVIEGTWPVGFNGQLAARTSSINNREIVLAEFGGDGVPVSDNGDVEQSRLVVSVELFGGLMVSCKAWRGDETMQDEVALKTEKKGRSFGTLRVGSCILEVLVAWSPIRPVCEELVSMSDMEFA